MSSGGPRAGHLSIHEDHLYAECIIPSYKGSLLIYFIAIRSISARKLNLRIKLPPMIYLKIS